MADETKDTDQVEETTEAPHPLDRQNTLERDIQLKGAQDPDNFKMPDGRTLSEVRQTNQDRQEKEFQEEIQMVARRTREQSIVEFQKGGDKGKLVMTPGGSIVDVTEPVPSERTISLSTSRTTQAQIDEGVFKAGHESGDILKSTGNAPMTGTSAESEAPTGVPASGTPRSIPPPAPPTPGTIAPPETSTSTVPSGSTPGITGAPSPGSTSPSK